MSEALKALSSQAPSSTLMPTWPLKSAMPRLSRRPARVTRPAPVMTPRMPSRGRVETSDGIAAAAPRAICNADGRIGIVEAAIGCRLLFGADGRHDGKPGAQLGRKRRIVQRDLHRNALHDFREVAGGVIGRQECEL